MAERGGEILWLLSSSQPLIFLLRSHWLNPAGSQETPEPGETPLAGASSPVIRAEQERGLGHTSGHLLTLSNTQSWVCRFVSSDAYVTLPLKRFVPGKKERMMGRSGRKNAGK